MIGFGGIPLTHADGYTMLAKKKNRFSVVEKL